MRHWTAGSHELWNYLINFSVLKIHAVKICFTKYTIQNTKEVLKCWDTWRRFKLLPLNWMLGSGGSYSNGDMYDLLVCINVRRPRNIKPCSEVKFTTWSPRRLYCSCWLRFIVTRRRLMERLPQNMASVTLNLYQAMNMQTTSFLNKLTSILPSFQLKQPPISSAK